MSNGRGVARVPGPEEDQKGARDELSLSPGHRRPPELNGPEEWSHSRELLPEGRRGRQSRVSDAAQLTSRTLASLDESFESCGDAAPIAVYSGADSAGAAGMPSSAADEKGVFNHPSLEGGVLDDIAAADIYGGDDDDDDEDDEASACGALAASEAPRSIGASSLSSSASSSTDSSRESGEEDGNSESRDFVPGKAPAAIATSGVDELIKFLESGEIPPAFLQPKKAAPAPVLPVRPSPSLPPDLATSLAATLDPLRQSDGLSVAPPEAAPGRLSLAQKATDDLKNAFSAVEADFPPPPPPVMPPERPRLAVVGPAASEITPAVPTIHLAPLLTAAAKEAELQSLERLIAAPSTPPPPTEFPSRLPTDTSSEKRLRPKGRLGRAPPHRRWRFYIFDNAFVFEPNITGFGLRYCRKVLKMAAVDNEGVSAHLAPRRLGATSRPNGRDPGGGFLSHRSVAEGAGRGGLPVQRNSSTPGALATAAAPPPPSDASTRAADRSGGASESRGTAPAADGRSRRRRLLPQLVVFRKSGDVVEIPGGIHDLYKYFGDFQYLFLVDLIIGMLRIANKTFVAVAPTSEAVAGFHTAALASNDCRPPYETGPAALDALIYRVTRCWLVPLRFKHPLQLEVRAPDDAAATRRTLRSARLAGAPPPPPASAGYASRSTAVFPEAEGAIDPSVPPAGKELLTSVASAFDSVFSSALGSARAAEEPAATAAAAAAAAQASAREAAPTGGDFRRRRHHDSREGEADVLPVTEPRWAVPGFGDAALNLALGERVAAYKQAVEKTLCTFFYYSYEIDVTHTLQRKQTISGSLARQAWPCFISKAQRQAAKKAAAHNAIVQEDLLGSDHDVPPPKLTWSKKVPPKIATSDKGFPPPPPHPPPSKSASSPAPSAPDLWSREVRFLDIADKRFVWNAAMLAPFLRAGVDPRWFVPLVQGSVGSSYLRSGLHGLDVTLLCRRSCRRAGTRYHHRGLDDEGNVANFNESEFIVAATRVDPATGVVVARGPAVIGGGAASLVQIRGSVPLFWWQNFSLQQINPAPELTRELSSSWQAFVAHQRELNQIYGSVTYVNLLSREKNGEPRLTMALARMLRAYSEVVSDASAPDEAAAARGAATVSCARAEGAGDALESAARGSGGTTDATDESTASPEELARMRVRHVPWDFHAEVKAAGFETALTTLVRDGLMFERTEYGFFCTRPVIGGPNTQIGVVRTNCLDCLDRTNAFQWFYCWTWLAAYLKQQGLRTFLSPAYRCRANGSGASDADLAAAAGRTWAAHADAGATAVDIRPDAADRPPAKVPLSNRVPGATGSRDGPQPLQGAAAAGPSSNPQLFYVESFGGISGSGMQTFLPVRPSNGVRPPPGPSRLKPPHQDAALPIPPFAGFDAMPTAAAMLAASSTENHRQYVPSVLKGVVARLWADHGDRVSRAYTGTGSVLSHMVRRGRKTLGSNIGHLWTSIERLYQNTFEDASRQEIIDLILGNHGSGTALPCKPMSLETCTSGEKGETGTGAPNEEAVDQFNVRETKLPPPELPAPQKAASVPAAMTGSPPPRSAPTLPSRPAAHPSADDITSDLPELGAPRSDPSVGRSGSGAQDPRDRRSASHLLKGRILPSSDNCEPGSLRVWFGSWNVGGTRQTEPLAPWIFPLGEDLPGCDVYVVAIQELVESTSFRILLNSSDREKEALIDSQVRNALAGGFSLVASHSLVGLYLTVFARTSLVPLLDDVRVLGIKLGFKGQMANKVRAKDPPYYFLIFIGAHCYCPLVSYLDAFGSGVGGAAFPLIDFSSNSTTPATYLNLAPMLTPSQLYEVVIDSLITLEGRRLEPQAVKSPPLYHRCVLTIIDSATPLNSTSLSTLQGAVMVRFMIGQSSLCFANVHLSWGSERGEQRRMQLRQILNTTFPPRPFGPDQTEALADGSVDPGLDPGNLPIAVQDHDCLIIGGDFNFRCDVSPYEASRWMEYGMWKRMLAKDQFMQLAGAHLATDGLREAAPVAFLPTYKYKRGSTAYDLSRIPAWCDRILVAGSYSGDEDLLRCVQYDRIEDLLSSDHRPIFARFYITVFVERHTK